jgi:Na+/H+ antiporter NhaD/arsenite permease-like protein
LRPKTPFAGIVASSSPPYPRCSRRESHRVLIIFSAVALLWLITYLTPYHLISFEGAHRAIDLNVILLLASMMALVGVLKTTGVFSYAVGRLMQRSGGRPETLLTLVVWFTAILSAFADNVTTVIFVYPMVARWPARRLFRGGPAAPNGDRLQLGGTATSSAIRPTS